MRGCIQAKFLCTPSRARKVVVSLTLVAITARILNAVCRHLTGGYILDYINDVLFKAIFPVSVLVINVVVVYRVRRAAANAAANLGVQPHHQSTSSSSAVPTVMLVATSLIYVLLYSPSSISFAIHRRFIAAGDSIEKLFVVYKSSRVALALSRLVFAYNFYIYIITGKKFRSELHKLFCCCLSSSSSSAAVVFADDAEVAIRVRPNSN